MVNGAMSRILYIGALALEGLIVVGAVVLALQDKPLPGDLRNLGMALFAFLFGSHVAPPGVKKIRDGLYAGKGGPTPETAPAPEVLPNE